MGNLKITSTGSLEQSLRQNGVLLTSEISFGSYYPEVFLGGSLTGTYVVTGARFDRNAVTRSTFAGGRIILTLTGGTGGEVRVELPKQMSDEIEEANGVVRLVDNGTTTAASCYLESSTGQMVIALDSGNFTGPTVNINYSLWYQSI